jgi:adenylate cyclase
MNGIYLPFHFSFDLDFKMKSSQKNSSLACSVSKLITDIEAAKEKIYADSTTSIVEKDKLFKTQLHYLLTSDDLTPAKELRQVTLLFADIQNFVSIFETSTCQEVINVLNRYFLQINEIIVNRFHGKVYKILGSSIMASFETPDELPERLYDVLACGIEMQIAMQSLNETNRLLHLPALYIGVGIHSGKAIIGQFGSAVYQEQTLVGTDINIATSVKNRSLRGQVLISEPTFQLVKQVIECSSPVPLYMKELKKSMNVYELKAIKIPKYLALPQVKTRQSPRVLVNVPIVYQCMKGKTLLPSLHSGEIMDISYEGMYACVSHPPELYSDIQFNLALALRHKKNSEVQAKVLTVTKEDDKFYIGVVFTDLDEETRFSIKQVIDVIRELIASQYIDILQFQFL